MRDRKRKRSHIPYQARREREKPEEYSLIKEKGKGDFTKERMVLSVKYGSS